MRAHSATEHPDKRPDHRTAKPPTPTTLQTDAVHIMGCSALRTQNKKDLRSSAAALDMLAQPAESEGSDGQDRHGDLA
jgi:hypothetical protein